ncbi:hypothetical protein EAG_12462 [Camponotus floridanus]|uniref:Uncharacterized protein n=1 Tax=Camponotus floridanus TaxID=104421 RepID=E2AQM8_CAMFO|nr:hypothetical protein EAG_12462 [Camponotus floridanus]
MAMILVSMALYSSVPFHTEGQSEASMHANPSGTYLVSERPFSNPPWQSALHRMRYQHRFELHIAVMKERVGGCVLHSPSFIPEHGDLSIIYLCCAPDCHTYMRSIV